MGAIPAFLLRHSVTIEPYEGDGPFGPEYGEQTSVLCFVDDRRKLVVGPTGDQVISETTVYMPLDTVCPVHSRVVLPSGRETTVLAASRRDGGGLPTPDHLEVACQ